MEASGGALMTPLRSYWSYPLPGGPRAREDIIPRKTFLFPSIMGYIYLSSKNKSHEKEKILFNYVNVNPIVIPSIGVFPNCLYAI